MVKIHSPNILLIHLINIAFFIATVKTATNFPTWSTNPNIKASTITICSNGSPYGGYYETSYSTSFPTVPSVVLSIQTIDISLTPPSLLQWKVNLPQATNLTHLKITMNYLNVAWRNFKVSYIGFIGLNYLKSSFLELTEISLGSLSTGTGTRLVQGVLNLGTTINSSNAYQAIPFVTGLKIQTTTTGDRGFSLVTAKKNSTNIFYNITCYGTTTITQVAAYILIYDVSLAEGTMDNFADFENIVGTNNVVGPVSLLYFNHVNLLVGVSQFTYTSGLSYNIEPSTLTFTIPTPGSSFTSITFSFWSYRKRNCPSVTPYYEKITNLCYDQCPSGHLTVTNSSLYCQSCSSLIPHCTVCATQVLCIICATGWKLNNLGSGCVCDDGYFLSAGSCLACDPTCLTCSQMDSLSCLTCTSNKYLSGNTCNNCDSSCATCNGSTSFDCLTCPTGIIFSAGRCFNCDSSCTTCNGPLPTDCLSCPAGQGLSGGSCVTCHVSCKTCSGILPTNCLSCRTSFEYLDSNNQCIPCVLPCVTCTSATRCLSCQIGKYLSSSNTCITCGVGSSPWNYPSGMMHEKVTFVNPIGTATSGQTLQFTLTRTTGLLRAATVLISVSKLDFIPSSTLNYRITSSFSSSTTILTITLSLTFPTQISQISFNYLLQPSTNFLNSQFILQNIITQLGAAVPINITTGIRVHLGPAGFDTTELFYSSACYSNILGLMGSSPTKYDISVECYFKSYSSLSTGGQRLTFEQKTTLGNDNLVTKFYTQMVIVNKFVSNIGSSIQFIFNHLFQWNNGIPSKVLPGFCNSQTAILFGVNTLSMEVSQRFIYQFDLANAWVLGPTTSRNIFSIILLSKYACPNPLVQNKLTNQCQSFLINTCIPQYFDLSTNSTSSSFKINNYQLSYSNRWLAICAGNNVLIFQFQSAQYQKYQTIYLPTQCNSIDANQDFSLIVVAGNDLLQVYAYNITSKSFQNFYSFPSSQLENYYDNKNVQISNNGMKILVLSEVKTGYTPAGNTGVFRATIRRGFFYLIFDRSIGSYVYVKFQALEAISIYLSGDGNVISVTVQNKIFIYREKELTLMGNFVVWYVVNTIEAFVTSRVSPTIDWYPSSVTAGTSCISDNGQVLVVYVEFQGFRVYQLNPFSHQFVYHSFTSNEYLTWSQNIIIKMSGNGLKLCIGISNLNVFFLYQRNSLRQSFVLVNAEGNIAGSTLSGSGVGISWDGNIILQGINQYNLRIYSCGASVVTMNVPRDGFSLIYSHARMFQEFVQTQLISSNNSNSTASNTTVVPGNTTTQNNTNQNNTDNTNNTSNNQANNTSNNLLQDTKLTQMSQKINQMETVLIAVVAIVVVVLVVVIVVGIVMAKKVGLGALSTARVIPDKTAVSLEEKKLDSFQPSNHRFPQNNQHQQLNQSSVTLNTEPNTLTKQVSLSQIMPQQASSFGQNLLKEEISHINSVKNQNSISSITQVINWPHSQKGCKLPSKKRKRNPLNFAKNQVGQVMEFDNLANDIVFKD